MQFNKPVFIVDPTQSGAIVWEEMVYCEHPQEGDYKFELHSGELLYTFPHIHFPFQQFPEQLTIESSRATRTRVDILREEPDNLFMILSQNIEGDRLLDVAENHVRCSPDASELLKLYVAFSVGTGQQERCLKLFESNFDDEQLNVDWQLAKQLNFMPQFPYHLVNDVLVSMQ